MDAADEAADPFQRLRVVELGHAAAAPRIHRDAKSLVLERVRWGDHGDLALGELARERVLFVDLRVAPAAGPVELRHHRRPFLQTW